MFHFSRIVFGSVCLLVVLTVPAFAQRQTGTVVDNAPIFIKPGAQTPLRVAAPGTILEILGVEGAWLNVRFQDPQFGTRVGYVEAQLVQRGATAPALIPVDLSVQQPKRAATVAPEAAAVAPPPVPAARPAVAVREPRTPAGRPLVFIEASETVDGSNSRDKARQVDFGSSIAAALLKKGVPVTVVADPSKADWTIKSVSAQREDSTGTKVAKLAFGGLGGFTKFEGSIQVIDNASTGVLYAYNVKKGNFQSAAEAFAKHFKGDYLEKR